MSWCVQRHRLSCVSENRSKHWLYWVGGGTTEFCFPAPNRGIVKCMYLTLGPPQRRGRKSQSWDDLRSNAIPRYPMFDAWSITKAYIPRSSVHDTKRKNYSGPQLVTLSTNACGPQF